jgi:alanine racemase
MDRQAHVDLGTVTGNIRALCEHVRGSQVMAVVKQDGYGHGALPCARAALAGGATWLGVAHIAEALRLRQAGLEASILCLGAVPGEEYQAAIAAGVDVTSGSVSQLTDVIAVAAAAAGMTARVQLKADTGLTRGGARPDQWLPLIEAALGAQQRGLVTVTGLWSHFACSDMPGHPSVAAQLAAFDEAVTVATKAGLTPEVTHIANTAAAITVPESRLDLVRIGGGMYGLSTLPGGAPPWLPAAMSLRAKLAMVKRIPAGTGVSYGLHYVTDRETTLGLVPLGYADGIRRSATGQPLVGFNGRRFPIAGTVCMDQLVVDFGDEPVVAGDEVVLFGPGGPSAQDWGEALGTISYEITVGLGPRVPRTFSHNSTTASPRTGS